MTPFLSVAGTDLQIKPNISKQTPTYLAQQVPRPPCMQCITRQWLTHATSCLQAITTKIVKRIEQTMAARAATDGAGLAVVKNDGGEDGRPLLKAPVLSQGKKKSAKR